MEKCDFCDKNASALVSWTYVGYGDYCEHTSEPLCADHIRQLDRDAFTPIITKLLDENLEEELIEFL